MQRHLFQRYEWAYWFLMVWLSVGLVLPVNVSAQRTKAMAEPQRVAAVATSQVDSFNRDVPTAAFDLEPIEDVMRQIRASRGKSTVPKSYIGETLVKALARIEHALGDMKQQAADGQGRASALGILETALTDVADGKQDLVRQAEALKAKFRAAGLHQHAQRVDTWLAGLDKDIVALRSNLDAVFKGCDRAIPKPVSGSCQLGSQWVSTVAST